MPIVQGRKACSYRTKLQFAGIHSVGQLSSMLDPGLLIAQAISLEKFHGHQSIHETHVTFPSTSNDLQCIVYDSMVQTNDCSRTILTTMYSCIIQDINKNF